MELLDEHTIQRELGDVAGWSRSGDSIVKTVRLADFRAAVAFVNAVADVAEAHNHHPDITVRWDQVTLTLSTHSAGGLTAADFRLARLLDAL